MTAVPTWILTQCVKLTLTRSPVATIYCHLATYFSFSSVILGNNVSGWLGCVVHGMRDITHEPMRPTEELENESEMTLELFGFVKQSAVTSHSPTAQLDSRQMPQAAKILLRHSRKQGASTVSGRIDTRMAEARQQKWHVLWVVPLLWQKWAQKPVCEGMCINEAWEDQETWTLEAAQVFWGCAPCSH